MSDSGESSLLRSLALALGQGLAFSVGMKVMDAMAQRILPAAAPLPVVIPPSAGEASFDHPVLTGSEAKLAIEMQTLERRVCGAEQNSAAVRASVDDKLAELRGHMVAINHEFAQAVAGIVRDEVARQVEARAAALREDIAQVIAQAIEQRLPRRPSNPEPPA
jgi:hypothetical protein